MFAAMSLLFLYLASVLPTMRIAMYFLSSVFVMGLVIEEEIGLAVVMYIGVSLMSLLLMPNILRVLPYVLFFGHYGIGKYYIQSRIKDKVAAYIIKLIYYNVAVALVYLLAQQIIFEDVLDSGIAFWLFVVLAEVAFVIYDFLFDKVTTFYFNNLRRMLMKN
jgi:uncharacterized membrane protein (GlpM family)